MEMYQVHVQNRKNNNNKKNKRRLLLCNNLFLVQKGKLILILIAGNELNAAKPEGCG